MAEQNAVHAPYNFVPFSNKILRRYSSAEELPRHDRLDASLKSGEIHVTMTADTPVFVSDGRKDAHFFRAPHGKYALPGSTIRGMVRGNMQILGFGAFVPGEDLEDVQVFFREIAAGRDTTGDALKKHYKNALDIAPARSAAGKPVSVPRNVHAGYLRKQGKGYCIQPVSGEVLRVPRSHPDIQNVVDSRFKDASGNIYTAFVPVAYAAGDKRVNALKRPEQALPGMKQGMLLFTGRPVGKKPNAAYLFPAADETAAPVDIAERDLLSYLEDWELRKRKTFWALPKDGEQPKPVFYIRYEGHIYFGMSLFLRIGHKFSLSEGLPVSHRRYAESGAQALDYPHAILGFAGRESAYRSRVSFSDLAVVGHAEELEYKTVLGQPNPGYYPGYAVQGKNYSEEGFRLRGRKQYWLKEVGALQEGTDKVTSTLRPLPKGTQFRGVIRFKNLHEDELGLLLWCLRLEENCFQSVGMGKPYGFGRMKLHIDRLLEVDHKSLYHPEGLCGGLGQDRTAQIAAYIDRYTAFASETLNREKTVSIREYDEIKDFFYIRSHIKTAEETGYMPLGTFKKCRAPLPAAADFREREDASETTPDKKKLSLAEMKAMLAERFNQPPNMGKKPRK